MNTSSLALAAIALTLAATAQASPHWVFYGHTDSNDSGDYFFFDRAGVRRLPTSNFQVWTKRIRDKDLDATAEALGKKSREELAKDEIAIELQRRVVDKEPLEFESTLADKLGDSARLLLMIIEAAVNKGAGKAHSQTLFEIDCTNRRYRALSISVYDEKGNTTSSDGPGTWAYAPPDSIGATLEALICPKT